MKLPRSQLKCRVSDLIHSSHGVLKNYCIPSKKFCILLLGLLVFAISLAFSFRGLYWSYSVHPDELTIRRYYRNFIKDGYLKSFYQTGWFILLDEYDQISTWFENKQNGIKNRLSQDDLSLSINGGNTESQQTINLSQYKFIQKGRNLNAILLALSALLVYYAALSSSLNPIGCAFAALLVGTNPRFVEFAHYCETDIALVFTMSLFLFVSTFAIKKKSLILSLLSMLIGGYAFSSKVTLAPLAVMSPILIAIALSNKNISIKKKLSYGTIYLLISAILFLIGFAYGFPTIYKDPSIVLPSFFKSTAKAYSEVPNAVVACPPFLQTLITKIGSLYRSLIEFGPPYILLLIASLFVMWKKEYRNGLMNAPLFTAVFVFFAIFCLPFIRVQETFPIFLCAFLLCAYFFDFTIKSLKYKKSKSRFSFSLAALLFLFAIFGYNIFSSLRMTESFLRRDTVFITKNWLRDSAKSSTLLTYDRRLHSISKGILPYNRSNTRNDKLFDLHPEITYTQPSYYFLRNQSFRCRTPFFEHFSNKLLPEIQKSVDNFEKANIKLKAWNYTDKKERPIFGQPDIDLWYYKYKDATNYINIPFYHHRPIISHKNDSHIYTPDFSLPFGTDKGSQISPSKVQFYYPHNTTNWLIVTSLNGDKSINLYGSRTISPRKTKVNPCETIYLSVLPEKKLLKNLSSIKDNLKLHSDTLTKSPSCIAKLTSDPVEVAFNLRKSGKSQEALSFIRKNGNASEESFIQEILASIECNETIDPKQTDRIIGILSDYDKVTNFTNSYYSVAGVPARVCDDFSITNLKFDSSDLVLTPGQYDITIFFKDDLTAKIKKDKILNVQGDQIEILPDNRALLKVNITKTTTVSLSKEFDSYKSLIDHAEIVWSPLNAIKDDVELLRKALQFSSKNN